MSTACFGPELWLVLHAMAFYIESPRLIARLVQLLGVLLPCRFCRESWPAFVAQLEHDTGKSVAEHVEAGSFPRFLYDAHNLVNDKLTRQRVHDVADKVAPALATELGLSPMQAANVARAMAAAMAATPGAYAELDKRPSYECVVKRYYISGSTPFPCAAVWRSLLLFTLNFSSDKAAPFIELLRVLAACLRAMDKDDYKCTASALVKVANVLESRAATQELQQDVVFGAIALGQASCEDVRSQLTTAAARRAYVSDLFHRTRVAAAGTCLNGVCK